MAELLLCSGSISGEGKFFFLFVLVHTGVWSAFQHFWNCQVRFLDRNVTVLYDYCKKKQLAHYIPRSTETAPYYVGMEWILMSFGSLVVLLHGSSDPGSILTSAAACVEYAYSPCDGLFLLVIHSPKTCKLVGFFGHVNCHWSRLEW